MSESLLTVPSFLRNTSDQQYTTHHDDDNDAKKGMIIVAIVLLFLFCIVALRHGCNLLIDVFILRDYDQSPVVRTVSKIRRWICPCWQPTTPDTGPDVEIAATNSDNNTQETVTMDMLLAGMTSKQKQQLVASIVPSKVSMTFSDEWRPEGAKPQLVVFPLTSLHFLPLFDPRIRLLQIRI
jgi:hypothetical protein